MGFGGVGSFTQLSDTPRSYAGQALKALGVKAGEDGLEFAVGLPTLDLGAGFNFLRVSQLGGDFFVEWIDIQSLIIALTGALNRLVTPPELVIPIPLAVQASVAASSPPGRTAFRTLLVAVPVAAAVVTGNIAGSFTSTPNLATPVPIISAAAVLV